jgi:hypothetical protein
MQLSVRLALYGGQFTKLVGMGIFKFVWYRATTGQALLLLYNSQIKVLYGL